MECRHGAFLEVDGGMKCLLCGAIIPNASQAAQKQAKNEPEADKPVKSQAKKRAAKTAGKGA